MTRERSTRTIDLLDVAANFLDMFGQPILYKDLTKVLIESGLWASPWGAEPDQILYSALHNDVKRYGSQSRFLFLGGGAFCTALVEGAEFREEVLPVPRNNVSPKDPYARPGDMPGDKEKRQARAEAALADKRCGNCTHLSWNGPNITRREVGSCSMYERNGRACVLPNAEPCSLWHLKTEGQIHAENAFRQRVLVEVLSVMAGGKSRL